MARLAAFVFLCIGLLLIVVSLKDAWFTLPAGWEKVDGELIATVEDVPVTSIFKKCLLVAVTVWFLMGTYKLLVEGWQRFLGWSFSWSMATFPLLLWYPQWVIVQDPDTSGDACWLQQQHDNITWLGGDVFRAHSERYNDIQLTVNMQDPPIYMAAFKTPTESLTSLGIEEIPEIVWWFGLNPGFSQFVGRGWFLSWIGVLALGMAAFGLLKEMPDKGRRKLLKKTFFVTVSSMSLLITSAMFPVLKAGSYIRKAKSAALEGEYSECLKYLFKSQDWMPSLKFDTTVIHQIGRMQLLQGTNDIHAQIYQIWLFEYLGHGTRAKKLLEELSLKRETLPRELQRELSRTWMRITIDDFNAGKVTQAHQQFGRICDTEPMAIQARFHQQLTSLQVGDIETNRLRRAEIEQLYIPYIRKDKRGVLATSWFILSQGEWNAGNARAAAEARRQSKGL